MSYTLKNPFPTVGYHGAAYFCDRETEMKKLLSNIENGNSTTLISIRRIGKTGLIQHTMTRLPKGWKGVYVDILASENLNHLLNLLSTSIIQGISEQSSIGKKVWNLIKSLRPIISFDALTGLPQATFDIKKPEIERSISEVLYFLDKQEFKTLIAIDEFQQILNYPESNMDSWFRGIVQQLKNVVFIFSGSQQHIMTDIFASPSRPFYRSTQILKLNKLSGQAYKNHIVTLFRAYNKQISSDDADAIISWCSGHTYFVQVLCNRVFSATENNVTDKLWKQQASALLAEQESIFINFRSLLTLPQWNLLRAIALEDKVFMPTASDFIKKYNLGNGATVKRSLSSLLKNQLVYQEHDESEKSFYSVYDIFFQQWVKEKQHKTFL